MSCETEVAKLPQICFVFARLQNFEDWHYVNTIGCKSALYSHATRIMPSEYLWSGGTERRLESTLLLSNHPHSSFTLHQVVFTKLSLQYLPISCRNSFKLSTFREKQNSDYLTNLVTELENRNLSLTASNRFHTQVWVRHFTFVGDCLAQSSLTHNSPNEIHKYFTYHYRHRWIFWLWCEDIKIYILP